MIRSKILPLKASATVLEIRRTSIIKGSSNRLLVNSRIITHRETVILIDPPKNEAAPRTA
jgi:hypothetical protein